MPIPTWILTFPGAFIVSNQFGMIIAMNDKAAENYKKDGGRALIGTQVLDCHPEPSRTKFQTLVESRQPNTYTIEKNGIKKLIYQTPWFENGEYAGFIELSLEIPFEMPHFVRK